MDAAERARYIDGLTDLLRHAERAAAREIVEVLVTEHVARVALRTIQALGVLAVRGLLVEPTRWDGSRN